MAQQPANGWVSKEAKRDYIPKSGRAGEGASLIGVVLVSLFFYAHQAWSTGFFMPAFGSFEAILLYGSIFLGAMGPIARSVTGSRNSARIPEIIASIFWIISSGLLLVTFPFDFTHFGDVVPEFLQFLVSWISNDIAWILLLIGMIGGIVFVGVCAYLYINVRQLLARPHTTLR